MAEEFSMFMDKLNHEPIEDQVAELKGVVVNMVNLIMRFIDNYTNELEVIYDKIISLETKKLIKELPDTEKFTPVPNLNPTRVVGRENNRQAIMSELKDIFNKRNGVSNKN